MPMNQNRIIRGTFGRLWLDNERLANIKSFEAKATIDYEDVSINGDYCMRKRPMGFGIAGTISLYKIDSFIASKVADGLMTGTVPEMTIVSEIADPTAAGVERIGLYGVQVDELTLASWENRTLGEEEVPFTASYFKYLDRIDKE